MLRRRSPRQRRHNMKSSLMKSSRGLLTAAALLLPPTGLAAADLAANGPLAVDELAFPDLVDESRGVPADAPGARPDVPTMAGQRRVPVKVHLPRADGPGPMVVVSHGAGGDWDTHHAQARHLATHGYAVLCIEHVGSNRERMTRGFRFRENLQAMIHDSREVLARPADVSFVITRAEEWNRTHEQLRGRLDLQRVGVLGHSFGGFTTMVVCGMRPAVDWLTPRVPPGGGLGPDLRDPRVTCGVALSPQGVGEPFFSAESFASLRAPLLGISGTQDRLQSGLPAEGRRDAFALWPDGPHAFVWLANARHLDFTDSTGSGRRMLPSPSRADVQPVVRAATLLFFNVHLGTRLETPLDTDADAAQRPSADLLRPYLRGAVDDLEVLTK